MKIDCFDDGFDETDDWDERWASAEAEADPEPEPEPEPDFGSGNAPEPEPDCGPEDWDDRQPEPTPDELWPRTEEGVEELPVVATPPALQSPSEALGDPQASEQGRRQAKRKDKVNFIMGPLCLSWVIRAEDLTKPAGKVGKGLWLMVGLEKDDFLRRRRAESKPIRVNRKLKQRLGITPSQCSRGIKALAAAGLIRIVTGGAGRCPVVVIVNLQPKRNDGDSTNP
jgi:hypothetical protein